METFKSNNNPFLKVCPFKSIRNDKKNILIIFTEIIKHKNIKELMDIQILLNKRLKELTLKN